MIPSTSVHGSMANETGPPDPPSEEPTVTERKCDSAVLTWSGSPFDGGCKITQYLVDIAPFPEKSPWSRVHSGLSTSCTVTGLEAGKSYVFRVSAENIRGISEPSKESDVVILPAVMSIQEEDTDIDESEIVETSEHIVTQPGQKFKELYTVNEEVGRGRFGTVYKCTFQKDNTVWAAKFIKCTRLTEKGKTREEVEIMNKLRNHPKLLNLHATFESPREMILVTEFISGGELFERVIADDFELTETDCILFMRQICQGVSYMHTKSIIHLDLKPENILCKTKNSHQIKIIDFGLAQHYDPETTLKILFGTPEFVAPEVVNYEPVSPASDMWSIGVICYVLLSGLSPFMGDSDSETFSNIMRVDYDFDDEAFSAISEVAKDFIGQLLVKRPQKRLNSEECLQHEWLKKDPRGNLRHRSTVKIPTEKLKKFVIRRKWLKSGNAIMAVGRMVSLTSTGSSRPSSLASTSSPLEFSECGSSSPFFGSFKHFDKHAAHKLFVPSNADICKLDTESTDSGISVRSPASASPSVLD